MGWGGGDDHVPVLCTYGACRKDLGQALAKVLWQE